MRETDVTDNFSVFELVHPLYIEEFGAERVAKNAMRYWGNAITALQTVREYIDDPITVNQYHQDRMYKAGGWDAIKNRKDLFINSGVRHGGAPYGHSFSGHYFGLCFDMHQDKYSPVELQQMILEDAAMHPHIVEMENAEITRTWLHILCGERHPGQKIKVFNP